jgi:hypothetical protein
VTENTPLQVPSRAVFTMVKAERRNSVLAAYEFARRNGFKFNLTYLPKDIPDLRKAAAQSFIASLLSFFRS